MSDRLLVHNPPPGPLFDLLKLHPFVELMDQPCTKPLCFHENGPVRSISVGDPHISVKGLAELMDNNPIVCSDDVSVPCPLGTLALIALGPLARACLILEPPAIVTNAPGCEESVSAFLATTGWDGGILIDQEERDLEGVYSATVMASIPTLSDWDELDTLYDECYGRSFYVRRDEDSDWHISLVKGRPHASFRLAISPGENSSLVRVLVIADKDGKCGAAQIVHMMNIMAGFEECDGLQ